VQASKRQAAAIPYRHRSDGEVEVLLVTSSAGRWTAPKGWIDPGRSAQETAGLEALEEAGVIGVVDNAELGVFEDTNAGGDAREVTVFALRVDRVLDHWQEETMRRREWMTIADAKSAVQSPAVAILLDKLQKRVRGRGA
jgi:8-oxo-dGTP pyrophosphatase MutT (NUDIX family)